MKKVFLLLVLFSVVACEQDDNDDVAINNKNIAGKWYFESSRLNENDYVLYSHDCATKHDYIELLETGAATTVKHSDCTSPTTDEPATWTLDGTNFTFTDAAEGAVPTEYEVRILTDYKLSLIETDTLESGAVETKVMNYSRY